MEFFSLLETVLQAEIPEQKIRLFDDFYRQYRAGLPFCHESRLYMPHQPSYARILRLVHPRSVPRRKNLHTREGKGEFLHAIVHIEYSAIDLALDAAWRFRHLPAEFYHDWLQVAADEIRHFKLLQPLLARAGLAYGDLPVHTALFDAAKNSPLLLERMAAVPRYLEANGLDVNPRMIARFRELGDDFSLEIAAALEIILAEEIGHVAKGDRWFKFACRREGRPADYLQLVKKVLPRSKWPKKNLNRSARLAAGFSESELIELETCQ